MENNEIMEKLLQEDKHDNSSVKNATRSQEGEIQISKIRIVSAKYKVYIILLAICICLLLLIYIPKEDDSLESNSSSYNQVNSQLDSLKRDIKAAEDDMDYLCNETAGIVNNEENLKNCLNNDDGCSNLPDSWTESTGDDIHYDFSNPISLSYLQTNSLYNEKMGVDEKKVLKNLNEYLIKKDISGNDKKKIGEDNILKISIGDPEFVEEGNEHFSMVSVDVEIKFDTIGDLTGFLYNIEKKMIDNRENRILYKIQSVSYDVVTNDEPQITDISMIAYYYHDENMDEKAECGNNSEDIQPEDDQQDDENISSSEGFIQKISNIFK